MDTIETIHGATIQHGSHNQRVYLMQLDRDAPEKLDSLLGTLDELAAEGGYSKIFAKVPAETWSFFEQAGYQCEAVVPRFYQGGSDCFFIGKYLDTDRAEDLPDEHLGRLLTAEPSLDQVRSAGSDRHPPPYIERCSPCDTEEMSEVYNRVFATYPFAIAEPDHIALMMQRNVRYYCIRAEGKIIALASAEIDIAESNAELTDFATLPEQRGRGLAAYLLRHMESDTAQLGIQVLYTIARADSFAMNLVFKRCGYTYAGFLANNTQIAGAIRSMTVWYKQQGTGS